MHSMLGMVVALQLCSSKARQGNHRIPQRLCLDNVCLKSFTSSHIQTQRLSCLDRLHGTQAARSAVYTSLWPLLTDEGGKEGVETAQ
jgi:hypothetical protein